MLWSAITSSFLASTVEFVEALTIVLAVGVTINWRSSLLGAGAAMLTLAALVALFGSALVVIIPIEVLRSVIGIILVLFGMQWLKKALLRYSGLKATHDEAAIYEEKIRELKAQDGISNREFNGFGFVTSFKSVLLEGLEVAFIVITFGATSAADKMQGIWNATIGASLAFLVVVILGVIARGPLTKIPENTLKFIVGIMLVTFGTFWSGEGLGIEWPFADLFLFALAAFFLLLSAVIVRWLKLYASTQKKLNPNAGGIGA
jgi:Predicted membrane protein